MTGGGVEEGGACVTAAIAEADDLLTGAFFSTWSVFAELCDPGFVPPQADKPPAEASAKTTDENAAARK